MLLCYYEMLFAIRLLFVIRRNFYIMNALKDYLESHGISNNSLALKMNLSPQSFGQKLKGEKACFKHSEIAYLLNVIKLPLNIIIEHISYVASYDRMKYKNNIAKNKR